MTADQLRDRIKKLEAEISRLQNNDLIDEENFATKMHLANLEHWLQQDIDTLADLEAENP